MFFQIIRYGCTSFHHPAFVNNHPNPLISTTLSQLRIFIPGELHENTDGYVTLSFAGDPIAVSDKFEEMKS